MSPDMIFKKEEKSINYKFWDGIVLKIIIRKDENDTIIKRTIKELKGVK